MKTPRHELAAILAERTLGSFNVSAMSQEVAAYLLDAGRTGELDSLIRDIMQYRADHGIVEVNAVSAHELTDKVRSDIEAQVRVLKPHAKQIIITHRTS